MPASKMQTTLPINRSLRVRDWRLADERVFDVFFRFIRNMDRASQTILARESRQFTQILALIDIIRAQ